VNAIKAMAKQYKKMQALADSAKKKKSKTENVLDTVTEAKVGIQGFVKKGNGFSAKLKQCYSDFQVYSKIWKCALKYDYFVLLLIIGS
jgi:hypothetical protein